MTPSLQRKKALQLILVLSAILACSASFLAWQHAPAYAATNGKRSILPGHTVPALARVMANHPTSKDKQLQLSISLNIRNRAALDKLIAAQNDPTSALYHQYLTPPQFAAQFGPTQETVNTVVAYLQSQGLHVADIAPNHLLINASGSVATVEQAFGVTLNDYVVNGRSVYAPTANPSVPDTLGGLIMNVGGLDNIAQYHHASTIKQGQQASSATKGFTPAELRTAYNANELINAGHTGKGQTIALFELDGYNPADVNTYLSTYNLGTPKYSDVLIDGATNTPADGAIEVELDMEVLSALAPDAAQKVYIGPNTIPGVNNIYNRIVTDNQAKVTSISWGICEAFSGDAELSTLNTIFAQGAAQGQSFFAASGDAGAYDCPFGPHNLAVDSPASDPHVVGVGGTALQLNADGSYGSESVWGRETQGGGGGISTHFTRPAYQSGTNLTNLNRMVPDVSANADPQTGYSVYCTVEASNCTGWMRIGGTSASAPLWAAIATDVNGYLTSLGKPTLGSASALLYKLYNTKQPYAAYHDVTTGNNLYYEATPGYDTASGIGTPDVWNIARDLAVIAPDHDTTTQLVKNGTFDAGASSWVESSAGAYEIVNSTMPHAGGTSANLCGYATCNDSIYQTVTLPAHAKKVKLSYWVAINAQNTIANCADQLAIRVQTGQGKIITTPQQFCNSKTQGWKQYTFDLTSTLAAYAGKSIRVAIQGKTSATTATDFFVDDVALTVTRA